MSDPRIPFRVVGGVLALLLAGCAFKGGPATTAPAPRPAGVPGLPGANVPATEQAWVSRPASLRVYPATRFGREGSQALLEARLELRDELGDPVKGSGQFHLELLSAARAGESAVTRQLYKWDVTLLTKEDNRKFYDPISRTYLLRLKLDELPPAGQPVMLQVTFLPFDGPRLTAQATLTAEGLAPHRPVMPE